MFYIFNWQTNVLSHIWITLRFSSGSMWATFQFNRLETFEICSTGGATCISCKFGHQVAQLALVQHLVIRWRHLHCFQSWPPGWVTCIATLPGITLLALSVSIELVSSSARVTSVKSQKPFGLTDGQTNPKIGPQVYLSPIKTHWLI